METAKWFTADWHLGETRFAIMQRPFALPMEMVDTLVERHNKLVRPEDLVYMLGDVVTDPTFLPMVACFNGRKVLVKGNHDRKVIDQEFRKYFEDIIPEGEGIEMEIEGIPCYLTHYPTQGRPDLFNLVGHIHSAWKVQLNMLNVGVDCNHFYPVPAKDIPFFYKAISEFYDEDVWVAGNPINKGWERVRGKRGRYFCPDDKSLR